MARQICYETYRLEDPPRIDVVARNTHDSGISITFETPIPISWHGDLYTWHPNHTWKFVVTGSCEKDLVKRAYQKAHDSLEWECRRVTENFGPSLPTDLSPLS